MVWWWDEVKKKLGTFFLLFFCWVCWFQKVEIFKSPNEWWILNLSKLVDWINLEISACQLTFNLANYITYFHLNLDSQPLLSNPHINFYFSDLSTCFKLLYLVFEISWFPIQIWGEALAESLHALISYEPSLEWSSSSSLRPPQASQSQASHPSNWKLHLIAPLIQFHNQGSFHMRMLGFRCPHNIWLWFCRQSPIIEDEPDSLNVKRALPFDSQVSCPSISTNPQTLASLDLCVCVCVCPLRASETVLSNPHIR